jgi:pentatricopeptide repeat protein
VACVNIRRIEKTEEFFRGLPQKESIERVWISYKIVVNSVGEMGSLDTAFLMLDEWEKNGLELDSVTLNTLFNGFYNNGRILDGEKIWWMTKIKNVIPEIRSYNSRLSGTCNDGKLEEAEWWCQNMIGASGTSCRRT